MRKTNKWKRGGTAMMVMAGLGLTNAGLSTAADGPVNDAVSTVLEAVQIQPTSEPAAETIAPVKIAEAPIVQVQSASATKTNLPLMRLRMTTGPTAAQIRQADVYWQGHIKGDKESLAKLGAFNAKMFLNQRFQVTISGNNDNFIEISQGGGGWPGFPIQNIDWERRRLSADMQRGLTAIIDRCGASDKPNIFKALLTDGDADIVKGESYEVECVPGSAKQRAKFTYDDFAQAELNAEGESLDMRQHRARSSASFGMMRAYVLKTPNGSIAQDRLECVKIQDKLKRDYSYNQRLRDLADLSREKCATNNYNWIRRRNGLPEVQ